MDVVDKTTGIFTRTIDQQEREIKRLEDQLQRLGADIQNTRETDARLSVHELTVLSREIERLSAEHESLLGLLTDLAPPIQTQPRRALPVSGTSGADDLRMAIRARDLSIFPVLVNAGLNAQHLVDDLREAGYAASMYNAEGEIRERGEASAGIWLGAMIPPANAVEIIRIARDRWPFLKYVHLSTDSGGPEDTHYTMFIGGSTSAAEGHLRCAPWTHEEFRRLTETMSFDELHDYVRQRYLYSPDA